MVKHYTKVGQSRETREKTKATKARRKILRDQIKTGAKKLHEEKLKDKK